MDVDFSKVFDTASHIIIADKVIKSMLSKWTVRWLENWLNGWSERVVMSGTKYSWRLVTSGVSQGLMLGPLQVNVFYN